MKQNTSTPTLTPSAAGDDGTANGGGAGVGTTEPAIKDAAAAGVLTAEPRGPASGPPGAATTAAAVASDGITGTWHNGVTVDALWAANEVRNAWMRVVGVGWKKLYNGSDGAFTALAILASQARQTGRPVNYRDETDGMAHEIYLW